MLYCPECKCGHLEVVDSRLTGKERALPIRRKRKCARCGFKQSTIEIPWNLSKGGLADTAVKLRRYLENLDEARNVVQTVSEFITQFVTTVAQQKMTPPRKRRRKR